ANATIKRRCYYYWEIKYLETQTLRLYFFTLLANIFITSLASSGIALKNNTPAHPATPTACSLKTAVIKGTESTINCNNKPSTTEPKRYLLEKKPILKIDLYAWRKLNE